MTFVCRCNKQYTSLSAMLRGCWIRYGSAGLWHRVSYADRREKR